MEERLRALGPEWPARARARERTDTGDVEAASAAAWAAAPGADTSACVGDTATPKPRRASQQLGRMQPEHLGYAHGIHESIPADFRRQLQEAGGTAYGVYVLAMPPAMSLGSWFRGLPQPGGTAGNSGHDPDAGATRHAAAVAGAG